MSQACGITSCGSYSMKDVIGLWHNQLWQWLEAGCRRPMLRVWGSSFTLSSGALVTGCAKLSSLQRAALLLGDGPEVCKIFVISQSQGEGPQTEGREADAHYSEKCSAARIAETDSGMLLCIQVCTCVCVCVRACVCVCPF